MVNAKVFCYTKNEYDMIEDFILYHAYLFGWSNIHIVDNGSTHDQVLEVYDRYRKQGVHIHVDASPHCYQGQIMSAVMNQYKDDCDFLLPLDTDEFVVATDCGAKTICSDKDAIHATMANLPETASRCRYYGGWHHAVIDTTHQDYIDHKMQHPVRYITEFEANFEAMIGKFFWRSKPFISIIAGNHDGRVRYGTNIDVRDIGLVHFHHTGVKRMFEKSHQHIVGYNYIQGTESMTDQLDKIAACMTSSRFTSYMGVHRVLDYYNQLIGMVFTLKYVDHVGRLPAQSEVSAFKVNHQITDYRDVKGVLDTKSITAHILDNYTINSKEPYSVQDIERVWMHEDNPISQTSNLIHVTSISDVIVSERKKT